MIYEQVDKIMRLFEFNSPGIRNVRRLEKKGYNVTISFGESANINTFYISLGIKTKESSSYSAIIKAEKYEELTKILDNMLKVFDNKITKFLDEMDDAFVSFKEENFVFDWT